MISEERLKEIVEQQGTIYCSSGKVWFPIRFTDHIGRIRDGYFTIEQTVVLISVVGQRK